MYIKLFIVSSISNARLSTLAKY